MTTTAVQIRIDALMSMPLDHVLNLFRSLPAPAHAEMDGEYQGHVHHGGDEAVKRAKDAFFFDVNSQAGLWLGKAYTPGAPPHGEGYNWWQRPGGVVRNMRFATALAPSSFDGRVSLVMHYSAFNNFCGRIDLIDEIRRLGDGAYLGIYTAIAEVPGFTTPVQPATGRTGISVFALTGPVSSWIGVDEPELEVTGG